MAADTPSPELNSRELTALADVLKTTPAAVYLPATGRIYRCPNPWHAPVHCERETTFTIPDAQMLAMRIRVGELGPVPDGLGPVVLAYGIPIPAGGL